MNNEMSELMNVKCKIRIKSESSEVDGLICDNSKILNKSN